MRVPQVPERMKEAPAHALRAVFAGIGQVLLVADRIKNRATDGDGTPPAAAPAAASATTPAGGARPRRLTRRRLTRRRRGWRRRGR